jgi:DNA-binding MarR family transcriptional regulator
MNRKELEKLRRSLRKLEREIEAQVEDNGSCCGITLPQCHLLMELGMLGKASPTILAKVLQLDKSTLSRTIDTMVQNGLLDRTPDSGDRRYLQLSLSAVGESLYQTLNEHCNSFYKKVFSFLPTDQHEVITTSLILFTEAMMQAKEQLGAPCCQPIMSMKEKKL